MRAVPGSGIFPSSILGLPAKFPQRPTVLVVEMGCGVGAPWLAAPLRLPAAGLLLHSQPECSSSIVPHCGTAPPLLLPHPTPPPPAQPQCNFQIPPTPHPTPLWKTERRKGPQDPVCSIWTLINTPTPSPPRDAGAEEGVVSDILHWINSTAPSAPDHHQHTQTHALHQTSRGRFLTTQHSPSCPVLLLSHY